MLTHRPAAGDAKRRIFPSSIHLRISIFVGTMTTPPPLTAALDDRYRIERELGAGGMAVVYLARDRKLDRDVALKVLRPELGAVLGSERFLAEIKISARLDHPHILTLIDSGNADGFLYYVLPYVRGESLRSKLDREQQLSIEEAVAITKQVASALDYAHRQGLVHRDIKPENILLQEGEAMLADFGIALAVSEAGGNRLTQTGLSLGTPQYMSPEQATGDRNIDARSDVYSLAAVFYEMLGGEPPVSGASAQSMIAKLMTEKPTRLRILRDSVPPTMDDAVAKALSKTAADRFATAGDFVRALEKHGTTESTGAAPAKKRKLIIGVAAAGIAAVALGGAVASGMLRTNEPKAVLGEKVQLTTTGTVLTPSISGDGKQLAYMIKKCGGVDGCRYSIVVQDVGSSVTRTILDGALSGYELHWSPDRRNIILIGTYQKRYGAWLVSALGAPARFLTSGPAAFYADGDSLLLGPQFQADSIYWVKVAGLDGVVRDSIKVGGGGRGLASISAVPGTNWMLTLVLQPPRGYWQVIDRTGKVLDKVHNACMCGGLATTDAVWLSRAGSGQGEAIVRIGIDRSTGKLETRQDTMVAGLFTGFSVTADGSAMVMDEGTYDYAAYALEWPDLLKGNLLSDRQIARASSPVGGRVSPDGSRILLRRTVPLGGEKAEVRYSILPFAGGQETPLGGSGIPVSAFWVDTVTVARSTRAGAKTSFALIDIRTGAQTETLQTPDSLVFAFGRAGNRWAWIPRPGDSLMLSDGRTTRAIPRPKNMAQIIWIAADKSPDRVFIAGWNVTNEAVIFSKVDINTGAAEEWATAAGEGGAMSLLSDGRLLIAVEETQGNTSLFTLSGPGTLKRFWVSPRPIASVTTSGDMKRAIAGTVDYRADAWLSKVVRPK